MSKNSGKVSAAASSLRTRAREEHNSIVARAPCSKSWEGAMRKMPSCSKAAFRVKNASMRWTACGVNCISLYLSAAFSNGDRVGRPTVTRRAVRMCRY